MKVWSELPRDREREGRLWVTEDLGGGAVFGPVRCRGEADNAAAATHHNPEEDPAATFGDHPYGVSRIATVVHTDPTDAKKVRSYGPVFLALHAVSGQAWDARQAGRTGIGIHGGAPGPGGTLRPTYGCLRLDNADVERLATLVADEQAAGRSIFYECLEEGPR